LHTEHTRQTDIGIERGFCDADVGIRGGQVVLRLADVGTPLEQRRWQSGGHVREQQRVDRSSARDRTGVASEQHADEILLLHDLSLELRDTGGGLRYCASACW
jgi:hypothetical protein